MYSNITILGNVGRAPELKYTPSGVAVCDFSLAVTDKWTDASGNAQEEATWFKVTCWKRQAETVAQYVTKGRQVMVVAHKIKAGAYLNKQGEAAAALEVTADRVVFLGGGNADAGNAHGGDEVMSF